MINFFRQIRQRLLTENRFRKYLLYATGEIILVVIGILFAIQINAWRIEKENINLEKKTLNKIKIDLTDDINNLKSVTSFKVNQVITSERLIELFTDSTIQVTDTIQFENDVARLIYFILPSLNNTAFETAKNNGYINEISNDSLVELLSEYYTEITLYQHVTETKRFTNAFSELILMRKYRLFSKNINALDGLGGEYKLKHYKNDKRTLYSIDDFRHDIEVENYINAFIIRLNIGINYLKNKEMIARQLIKIIDNELISKITKG